VRGVNAPLEWIGNPCFELDVRFVRGLSVGKKVCAGALGAVKGKGGDGPVRGGREESPTDGELSIVRNSHATTRSTSGGETTVDDL